jgi:hypothetical protein
MKLAHEDFVAKYFTAQNAVIICNIFDAENLEQALDIFEDTREGWQVDEMLVQLAPVTGKEYVWDEDEEMYFC